MNIKRFEKSNSEQAHNGTILGSGVIPDGMKAPFKHFYGYLETKGTMEGHSHPTDEIYIVLEGEGVVVIGEETAPVRAGDVVEVPAGIWHTMKNESHAPLLWAALWWDVIS